MTPYEALYGVAPPLLIPYFPGDSAQSEVNQLLQSREERILMLRQQLLKVQNRMKTQADKKRCDKQFAVGNWVWLKLQAYRQQTVEQRLFHKLSPKFFGPFLILARVGEVAYKLALPEEAKIHNVFHVSLLKQAVGPPVDPVQWPTMANSPSPLCVPVAVLDRKMVKRGRVAATQVLVSWSDGKAPTWEFFYDLSRRFPDFCLEDKA